jgi:hypothetical protein
MKLRLKHGECEFECDAPDEVVAEWRAKFDALVSDFYGAKRAAQLNAERLLVQRKANAAHALRSAIKEFEKAALA